MFRILAIASIALLFTNAHAEDCSQTLDCGKCKNHSEFAWNPNQSYVTKELSRFYQLPELLEKEFRNGSLDMAHDYANEYLALANTFPCNWNYGNAIHDANRYMGLINYKKGKLERAVMYLVEAGKTPGSMQLNTFGPELDLANLLLKKGKKEAVLSYLNNVNTFWKSNDNQVTQWMTKIEQGKTPALHRYSQSQFQERYSARHIY